MIGLFSSMDFDTKSEDMKELIKPFSKVICFSASDWDWQIDNPQEFNIEGRYFNEQYAPFYDFGIQKEDFYIVNPNDTLEFVQWKFKQADLVVFLGGYMEELEFILNDYGLWNCMEFYKDQKNFLGVSAGALIMLKKYDILPNVEEKYTEHHIEQGLGLVDDIRLIVHFDEKNKYHQENLNTMIETIIFEMVKMKNDITLIVLADGEEYIIK